nr:serine/arginine repetitive matrix protein 2 [Biomphalaria glabrata]
MWGKIYLQWANSVLAETGSHISGADSVKDGQVLCQLIDILAPSAGLVSKVITSGRCTALDYVTAALDHMQKHGIRVKFPAEDITNNEIKSILDILWILILNYGIHYIGQNAFQRSVGAGKKNLLEWCMEQLGTTFDFGKSLSENLCQGDWFVKLLEKAAQGSSPRHEMKTEYIDTLLTEIQNRYGIRKEILKATDIVDGTIDEHTLMIYLSLFRRRCPISNMQLRKSSYGENATAARDRFAGTRTHQVYDSSLISDGKDTAHSRSASVHHTDSSQWSSVQAEWQGSPYQSQSLDDGTMYETVIENVNYSRVPGLQSNERDPPIYSGGTNFTASKKPSLKSMSAPKPNLQRQGKVNSGSFNNSSSGKNYLDEKTLRSRENSNEFAGGGQEDNVRIKRPKDYILQWEETIDRLSTTPNHDSNHLMGRSRSFDLGKLDSYQIQEKNDSRRSKSTEIPSKLHSTRLTTPVEFALKRLPKDMQENAKSAAKFFLQADVPEVFDLINVIQSSRVKSPSSYSENFSQHILDDNEETSLKSVGDTASTFMSHRFQSLSPRRRAVSPILLENGEERGSNTMLSIYPRDRSQSPSPTSFSELNNYPTLSYRDSEHSLDVSSYDIPFVNRDTQLPLSSSVQASTSVEKRAGSGRIPRREAWEQQRRFQSIAEPNANSGLMNSLSQEIKLLKEKVYRMEEEKERRRRLSRSRLLSDGSPDGREFENSTLQHSRARATSCPLLNMNSQTALEPSLMHLECRSEANLYQPLKPRSPQTLLTAYKSSSGRQPSVTQRARMASPNPIGTNQDTSVQNQYVSNWRQLISKRPLSEAEVAELKKALACAVADNDMLVSRLESAREEVSDKLRHTNSVLDDCRHHLAKAQVENMEYRSLLEQERQKTLYFERRVKELEHYFSELRANNEELEMELGQTTSMLNKSITETIPEVQALKLENTQIMSKLSEAENENDFLREDVQNLKQRHSKAMDTIEELKDILSKVRKERQELYDEVAAYDRREQAAKILKIMNTYMEKGSKDEEEKERSFSKWNSQSANQYFSPAERRASPTRYLHSRSVTPPSSQQRYFTSDDGSVEREIYPHRRNYTSRSRSCSPQQSRSRSVSPVSKKYTLSDHSFQTKRQDSPKKYQNGLISEVKKSQFSYDDFESGSDNIPRKSNIKRSTSPGHSTLLSSNLSQGKGYSSMQDLTRSSSPKPGILKRKKIHKIESTAPSRSPSASYARCFKTSLTTEKTRKNERPLHQKSDPGEIARAIQIEFDQDDQLIEALSRSTLLQNKSWFELQSDTDESGINSSMSSCEHSLNTGKRSPLLTEEQRRYADQLVQKYTGNVTL